MITEFDSKGPSSTVTHLIYKLEFNFNLHSGQKACVFQKVCLKETLFGPYLLNKIASGSSLIFSSPIPMFVSRYISWT